MALWVIPDFAFHGSTFPGFPRTFPGPSCEGHGFGAVKFKADKQRLEESKALNSYQLPPRWSYHAWFTALKIQRIRPQKRGLQIVLPKNLQRKGSPKTTHQKQRLYQGKCPKNRLRKPWNRGPQPTHPWKMCLGGVAVTGPWGPWWWNDWRPGAEQSIL